MSAPQSLTFVRNVFPARWLALLGTLFCSVLFVMLAIASQIDKVVEAHDYLAAAALVSGFWWLLQGSRLCALVYRMSSLRLPKVGHTMLKGGLLHFAVSIALPLAVLPWTMPQSVDALALLGAVCLGSALGLLTLSMPAAIPLIPVIVVANDWNSLLSDSSLSLLAAFVSLGAVGLLWRWHITGGRHSLMTPFGALLDGVSVQLPTASTSRRVAALQHNVHANPTKAPCAQRGQDVLAALLGPSCQTLRQLYGQGPALIVWTMYVACCLGLILWTIFWPHSRNETVFFAVGGASVFAAVMGRPAYRLWALQQKRYAGLGELMLTPGLPDSKLLATALIRQVWVCLVERGVLVSLVIAAVSAMMHPVSLAWVFWWIFFSLMLLLYGTANAALAWQGQSRHWAWISVSFFGIALACATNVLLAKGLQLPGLWILVWAIWITVSISMFWWLRRK
ncbi:MAG: hypothetical protein RR650_14870 [Comamonas sp.]